MATIYRRVIDADGYYKTLVLVTVGDTGEPEIKVLHGKPTYVLKEGESLVEAPSPNTNLLCRPRWYGASWTEGATAEEVAAWEAAKPIPEPASPSQVEQLAVEVTMAMATMQLQHDMAIAELTMAMAGMEVKEDV